MRLFCVETLFHAFLDLVVGVPCAVVSLLWPLRTYVHEDVPVKGLNGGLNGLNELNGDVSTLILIEK